MSTQPYPLPGRFITSELFSFEVDVLAIVL
jgi:hypothetical protein